MAPAEFTWGAVEHELCLVLLGSQGTSLEFLRISLLLVAGCWARRACGMDPPRGGSYSAKGNSLEKGVAVNF